MTTFSSLNYNLKINTERVTRSYEVALETILKKGKTSSKVAVVLHFDITFYGKDDEGFLKYSLVNKKRFLLNEKGAIVRKPNKAQKIALLVGGVNDVLDLKVDKTYGLVAVTNTEEIRKKWSAIKSDLLDEFPDLEEMAEDFSWQLQEEHIQQVFQEDHFLNFFFSGIFSQKYEADKAVVREKIIPNALGTIPMPISERLTLNKPKAFNSITTCKLAADLDTQHEKFSMPKLNYFIGKFSQSKGEQHGLSFTYKGVYTLDIDKGRVFNGTLNYVFTVGNVYKNETTITFNTLEDE